MYRFIYYKHNLFYFMDHKSQSFQWLFHKRLGWNTSLISFQLPYQSCGTGHCLVFTILHANLIIYNSFHLSNKNHTPPIGQIPVSYLLYLLIPHIGSPRSPHTQSNIRCSYFWTLVKSVNVIFPDSTHFPAYLICLFRSHSYS